MTGFTCSSGVSFSGKIDSKGRITAPARIRDKFNLKKGDRVSIALRSTRVVREKVSSKSEALEIVSDIKDVKEFSFDGEVLEAVLRDK
ncbi:MAG: AbrB/MazE/SpoVT family DNA-binding domain-containing protein [Nanohaloarchaea archaeon]|nr:AbrB/MazE/SpoVT family DNA-binding domain-containing protein [Candidatus Nanohaloarchaea archaeon]